MPDDSLRAVSFDAMGTLLHPRESIARTYARLGALFGVERSEAEIRAGFGLPMGPSRAGLRGDGRSVWRSVVTHATGCSDPDYFEAVYGYFAGPEAWFVVDGVADGMRALGASGLRTAITSNWDNRLPPLLEALGILVDEIVVSGEVGFDKPDPRMFETVVARLGVAPARVLHVGDDVVQDVEGARAAGLRAVHWGSDVRSMADVLALTSDG